MADKSAGTATGSTSNRMDPAKTARRAGWSVFLLSWVVLTFFVFPWRGHPPLPRSLTLQIKFPTGIAGRTEPLVATGVFAGGDFLVVTYQGENTAVFAYDTWGSGGPSSAAVKFEPGSRHRLLLEMPGLAEVHGVSTKTQGPLRLEFDDREILRAEVSFHRRDPERIFFGENPVGGDTSGVVFRGEIFDATGRPMRGGPASFYSRRDQFARWFIGNPWQVFAIIVMSGAVGFAAQRLMTWRGRRPSAKSPLPDRAGAAHRWFAGTALLCTLAFTQVVTGGSFRLRYPESFGSFYDHQAVSLLHGRLDVPGEALSGEAFVVEGKYYGYFGPTPALLRVPFAIFGVAPGQLSRGYMVVEYGLCLVAVYLLLGHAVRMANGPETWPSRGAVVIFVASVGMGSTLFFLGSRAYVYHEAMLGGAAFALWGSYGTLRYLQAPDSRWWIGALVCGTLAVHSRPPVGLFALSLLGGAALVLVWRSWVGADGLKGARVSRPASSEVRVGTPAPPNRLHPPSPGFHLRQAYGGQVGATRAGSYKNLRKPLVVAVLAAAAVLSFNGMSYLKFKTFGGAPLKYHVQYDAARLASIEGRNFHPGNFRYNFDTYAWRPNFFFQRNFPWFYMAGTPAKEYPGAKIDVAEGTLALPFAMPSLFFLAILGGGCAVFRWKDARLPLAVLAAATVPMAGALFMAIAISHRYTGDFCPALIVAAAFGLAALDHFPRGWRRALLAIITLLTLGAIALTVAITLHFQGAGVWGVPDDVRQHYQTLRKTIDGLFGYHHR